MSATRFTALLFLIAIVSVQTSRAAQFERTLPASPGARLDVRLLGGEVVVKAWNRDAVRVRSVHFETDEISCEATGNDIRVRARTRAGAPHGIDLEIDVPPWMPIAVVGPYVDVATAGTHSDVTVETVRGDIRVEGGSGTLTLSSIEGQVVLERASGTARLRAANNGVRVSGFDGTLQSETVDGSVRLRQVAASEVRVSTMAGDILWEGPLARDGSYELTTHSGDVDLTVPSSASATIEVHAMDGHVRSAFQRVTNDGSAYSTFVLGTGGARLLVESFNGIVSIRPSS